jgi:acyl-coenzyme A thioesterase PaaI-like protein
MPVTPARKVALAFLKAILECAISPAPIQATLGFDLIAAEEGLARLRVLPGEHLYNPMDGVHGSVACTPLGDGLGGDDDARREVRLLDSRHRRSSHPLHLGDDRTDRGRAAHRPSRQPPRHREGRLTDGEGRLLAHATTTCVLRPRH